MISNRDREMVTISTDIALKRRIEVLETRNRRLRLAAGAFRAKVRRLKEVIDTIPVGVSECNADGEITFANATLAKMAGYPAGDMLGKRVWDLMPSGAQKNTMPAYLKFLGSRQPGATSCVTRLHRKNGEISDIQVEWAYRKNEKGEVSGYTAVHTDIGDRMRADEILREARATLESRLADRTAELLRVYRQLERLADAEPVSKNRLQES